MPDYEDIPVRPSIPRSRGPHIAAVLGTIFLLLVVIGAVFWFVIRVEVHANEILVLVNKTGREIPEELADQFSDQVKRAGWPGETAHIHGAALKDRCRRRIQNHDRRQPVHHGIVIGLAGRKQHQISGRKCSQSTKTILAGYHQPSQLSLDRDFKRQVDYQAGFPPQIRVEDNNLPGNDPPVFSEKFHGDAAKVSRNQQRPNRDRGNHFG